MNSGQWDYSVSWAKDFGTWACFNTAGPSSAVNICDTIMPSFVLGYPTDSIFSGMLLDNPGLFGFK